MVCVSCAGFEQCHVDHHGHDVISRVVVPTFRVVVYDAVKDRL